MSRRSRAALWIAGILVVGVGLNVAGVAPIPAGPVGAAALMPSGNFTISVSPAGRVGTDGATYTTLALRSRWPMTATLISVTPVLATQPTVVRVLGSLPNRDPSAGLVLGSVRDPGPGWQHPAPIAGATIPTGDGPANLLLVLVEIRPTTDGDAAVGGFWLDYAVGPFRFRAADETAVLICAAPGTPTSYPDQCTH